MPDNVHKYGFRPYRAVHSAAPMPMVQSVATAQDDQDDSANSINLNVGDPVIPVSTGGVGICQADTPCLGIISGIKTYWDGSFMRSGTYLPNATTWGTVESRRSLIYVLPASAYIWEIDVDDKTTATTRATYQALVGENCQHTTPGDTSAVTADPFLDISDHATTHNHSWRIVGISDTADNRYFDGSYVKLLVQINESYEAGSPTTMVAGI